MARMRLIRRWSLMSNTSPENIQEHSHMVALVAHALATIGRVVYGKTVDAERAAFFGLLHDASEVMTGDMPTPVKYFDESIRAAYKNIEQSACERLLSFLPPEFRDAYAPAFSRVEESAGPDAEAWRWVKAADKLCAWLKCVEELRGGNREFSLAEKGIREQLDSMEMEEISYFMEHFAPGFAMSLDELGEAGNN